MCVDWHAHFQRWWWSPLTLVNQEKVGSLWVGLVSLPSPSPRDGAFSTDPSGRAWVPSVFSLMLIPNRACAAAGTAPSCLELAEKQQLAVGERLKVLFGKEAFSPLLWLSKFLMRLRDLHPWKVANKVNKLETKPPCVVLEGGWWMWKHPQDVVESGFSVLYHFTMIGTFVTVHNLFNVLYKWTKT